MKALNIFEIDQLIGSCQPCLGWELQDCFVSNKDVILILWRGERRLLWFDLNPLSPCFLMLESSPLQLKKLKKPIALFCSANLKGSKLVAVERKVKLGRVVEFEFIGGEGQSLIEFRCMPHGQNLIMTSNKKSMSWSKPKDLLEVKNNYQAEQVRSALEIQQEWLQRFLSKKVPSKKESEASEDLLRAEKKKRKILEKLKKELLIAVKNPWRELAEALNASQNLRVNQDLAPFIDKTKSLGWNIKNAFEKAKKSEAKRLVIQERIDEFEKDLSGEKPLSTTYKVATEKKNSGQDLFKVAQAKGRKLNLADGLEVYIGKSAKDNVNLLRKARSWDYWLHLKDYPGSYGILRRNKKQKIDQEILVKAARWVTEVTFGEKAKEKKGERFEVLLVECRYVKPIRGDKLGRVTFSNEQVLKIRL